MNKIKIGVVEDELIVAYDICRLLTEIGYETLQPCANYEEALTMLSRDKPDLAILDVMLGEGRDGIDIAQHIRLTSNIPLIFLTANSDASTLARAQETLPDAYLIKPFYKAQLFSAIEMAVFAHQKRLASITRPTNSEDPSAGAIFIKDGDFFQKISHDEIIFLSSNQNYVGVHTADRRFMVRATLQDYLRQLNRKNIVRIHRSYAVNIHKIEKVGVDSVVVARQEIPLSKTYLEDLYGLLQIK